MVLSMQPRAIESWTWRLIYAGLLMIALGTFMLRTDAARGLVLGWALVAVGSVLTVAGVAFIVWRARYPTQV
ncbi:MAG: hypothetical protein LH480_00705 [Rubrivivax sp.]|nr:hypothetical protein [Rubrivivax sp.]